MGSQDLGGAIRWMGGLALAGLSACTSPVDCASQAGLLEGGADLVCEMAEYRDRDFLLHVPASFDGESPLPVVFSLHGYGLSAEEQESLTCPDGDLESPDCLNGLADREGFAVVSPNGGGLVQSWNDTTERRGDDLAYIDAVLAEVEATLPVDAARVYSVGFSNGGSMTHTLGCRRSEVFAAIGSVSGARELAAEDCAPDRPVPVLQIHGDDDPVWPYEGGGPEKVASVAETMVGTDAAPGWARINGCETTPEVTALEDLANDETSLTQEDYLDCEGGVEVRTLVIEGGGHTWPQGEQWKAEWVIGPISQELSANETLWDFLSAHSMEG